MTTPQCEQRWRDAHREQLNEYLKEWHKNHPEFQIKRRIYCQKWKKNNLEKRRAELQAWRNISIIGQKCAICGSTENLERHHPDYSKPLEVVFLCTKHHPKNCKRREQQ